MDMNIDDPKPVAAVSETLSNADAPSLSSGPAQPISTLNEPSKPPILNRESVSRPPSQPPSQSPVLIPKPETPQPRPDSASATAAQKQAAAERPLNVTDALSYLDAVKVQFQEKPEVYNKFLDIMKDFKSQVIDTPGVIQRVSRLFHGNPELIQGFNTFLPQGYRIEVSDDPLDPNTITVTTPSGTTTQSTTTAHASHIRPSRDIIPGMGPNLAHPFPGLTPPIGPPPVGPISRALTPQGYQQPPPPFDHNSPGLPNPQTTAAASFLGGLKPVEKQPGEFNHAIHYLHKIKIRYPDDTNVYKQFLDILQSYQKEQKQIQDSQVYAQVQQLFKDAPDLLAEFKAFLPDGSFGLGLMPPAAPSQSWPITDPQPSIDKNAKKPSQPVKRKKKVEKDTTPVPPPKPVPSRVKKAKHHHKPETDSPTFSAAYPHSPQPHHLAAHSQPSVQQQTQISHTHSLSTGLSVSTASDKLLFFDRAKKALENREIYEEFLKLLNLFSRDIIDLDVLVENARTFLGDGDLMAEFKELVGWDPRRDNVENGPPGSIRTAPPEALAALPSDDGQGPSYRRLPESEVHLACSGRDVLGRSVLNDEWVSHPTWASEEAGFATHKKNAFEEALHKSEEERHEFHVHLEALARTIAVLEPIQARLDDMSPDERSSFKLKPDFGGSGRCIYHRIIKKIYASMGPEIIIALQESPSVAVPIVLFRLRQKDEEWRRAQREWSRTWREGDSKNFYKSLDHQGITFKANDKKNITAKYFVSDIESVRAQQTADSEADPRPSFVRGSAGFQLEYSFQDTPVLQDSLKMVYSFLDRSQSQYSPLERRSTESFLRSFVPLLCMYPAAEFNAACGPPDAGIDEEINHDQIPDGRSGRRSTGSTYSAQSNGIVAGDLRKKLMRTAQERNEQRNSISAVGSRAVSPLSEPNLSNDEDGTVWIKEVAPSDGPSTAASLTRPFFANTTFYTLIRLIQLLYSRLVMCKEAGAELARHKHAELLANPVAVELGLDDPNGPSTVLATMETLSTSGEELNVVYMYLLDACEKYFAGDLDQATFEEHMRWFFGNKAYHLFTLDKLISAIVKQCQTVLADSKSLDLLALLQSAQNTETISNQDIIRYRREAERQADNLYRIQWVRDLKVLKVQLMSEEDASVDNAKTRQERWREYVDAYVLRVQSEWVPLSVGGQRLSRTARSPGSLFSLFKEGEMHIRINLPDYKILYEAGSEETMWRKEPVDLNLVERAAKRAEDRKRCRLLI
ncbi:hypothetical protein C8J56DRAFT_920036 [Mycena floridula]|nr:hypothetical protein C8J56DRAFT_920036 [Mycena floridula]